MQSLEKLQERLKELLGPPGPDSDPLELTLRTVVAVTAPTIELMIEQMTPDQLDVNLERVAMFFLDIRTDGQPLSDEFAQEIAHRHEGTIESTATDEIAPELTPAAAAPAPPAVTAEPPPAAAPPAVPPSLDPPPPPASSPEPPSSPSSPSSSEPSGGSASEPGSSSTSEEHPPAPPWG